MKLHEILDAHADQSISIDIEKIKPYKRSLITVIESHALGSQAMLMVTAVFNAGALARVIPMCDFSNEVANYVATIPDLSEEEREHEIELIHFQSMPLKNL